MTNRSFAATDSHLEADKRPISTTTFKQRLADSLPMRWYEIAPGYGYDPYLVRFVSQNGDSLRFVFIDSQTGLERGAEHVIGLSEHELVHSEAPATLPDGAAYAEGRHVGFLMLNPRELDRAGLRPDAVAANALDMTASGKWPGGAGAPAMFFAVLKRKAELEARVADLTARADMLADALRAVRQDPGVPAATVARLDELMSRL